MKYFLNTFSFDRSKLENLTYFDWNGQTEDTLSTQFSTMFILSRYEQRRNYDAATSKMECFVVIVNGFKPLTIITKRSILDVAAALDPPLMNFYTLKRETINARTKSRTKNKITNSTQIEVKKGSFALKA